MKHSEKKDINNYIIVVIFVIFIFLPQIIFPFIRSKLPNSNTENRKLAEKPNIATSCERYPKDFEEYWNDNLPFRNLIKQTWENLNILMFNQPTDNRVILGKREDKNHIWLFYNNVNDGNSIIDVRGIRSYSTEEKESIKENIINNTNRLRKKNIELYYVVVPNKENVYKEKLPYNVFIENGESRVDNLCEWLKNSGINNLIYLKDTLLAGKEREHTFLMLDTHWNNYGAYICTNHILETINGDNDNVEYEMKKIEKDRGDLKSYLNTTLDLKDEDYEIIDKYSDTLYKMDQYNTKTNKIVVTNNDEYLYDETIMVVGDSFREAMIPYIARLYKNAVFVHRGDFEAEMIEKYNPDVVIVEYVERWVDKMDIELED